MVPRLSISSARSMPTPLSSTVSVPACLVGGERDPEVGDRRRASSGLVERQHAELLAGVGGVGDQFAQEDVAVRIDRMHHEVRGGARTSASKRDASSLGSRRSTDSSLQPSGFPSSSPPRFTFARGYRAPRTAIRVALPSEIGSTCSPASTHFEAAGIGRRSGLKRNWPARAPANCYLWD